MQSFCRNFRLPNSPNQKIWSFKKFYQKVDAGSHVFIWFRLVNIIFIAQKGWEVCLHPFSRDFFKKTTFLLLKHYKHLLKLSFFASSFFLYFWLYVFNFKNRGFGPPLGNLWAPTFFWNRKTYRKSNDHAWKKHEHEWIDA